MKYSEKLAARGFVTAVDAGGGPFAVEKAQKDLEIAKTKLHGAADVTKAKMLNSSTPRSKRPRPTWRPRRTSTALISRSSSRVEEQIAKCTIIAPQDGEVTYANSSDMRDSDAVIIKEGVLIRERQTDRAAARSRTMQVNTKVNEAKIHLIKIGMPATLKVEALAGEEL